MLYPHIMTLIDITIGLTWPFLHLVYYRFEIRKKVTKFGIISILKNLTHTCMYLFFVDLFGMLVAHSS